MKSEHSYPLALEAPATACTRLTRHMADHVCGLASQSPRGRIIQRLHKTDDDPFQRLLNAMQPGTYFRPHRHLYPPKSETMVVLRGTLRVIVFHDDGTIAEHFDLSADGDCFGVDLLPEVFHTIIPMTADTIIFEAKTGPYVKTTDKDFAAWAPAEGTPEADAYLEDILRQTRS